MRPKETGGKAKELILRIDKCLIRGEGRMGKKNEIEKLWLSINALSRVVELDELQARIDQMGGLP